MYLMFFINKDKKNTLALRIELFQYKCTAKMPRSFKGKSIQMATSIYYEISIYFYQ